MQAATTIDVKHGLANCGVRHGFRYGVIWEKLCRKLCTGDYVSNVEYKSYDDMLNNVLFQLFQAFQAVRVISSVIRRAMIRVVDMVVV